MGPPGEACAGGLAGQRVCSQPAVRLPPLHGEGVMLSIATAWVSASQWEKPCALCCEAFTSRA
jgi:hypothetical protein